MAMIEKLEKSEKIFNPDKHSKLREVTYSITEKNGKKFLKIDTYGSTERENTETVSQSIVFNTEILKQLQNIIRDEMQL